MALDSYDSRYPLAYYEIGTAYSFYSHNAKEMRIILSESEEESIVQRFVSQFDKAFEENRSMLSEKGEIDNCVRLVGVVVEKKEEDNQIVVLFQLEDGKYGVKSYATDYHRGVWFDGNEIVMPKAPMLSDGAGRTGVKPEGEETGIKQEGSEETGIKREGSEGTGIKQEENPEEVNAKSKKKK